MGTKRLARTVIEGGRGGYNKNERWQSNRVARRQEDLYLRRIGVDPDLGEGLLPPRRRSVYKGFRDKLGPAERWLAAQVGERWVEVEGRILASFDTRTLAGRHIVFDHLLPRAGESVYRGWRVHRRAWFFVDRDGVLRTSVEPPDGRYARHARARTVTPYLSARAVALVGERRIGVRGSRAYWLVPTRCAPPPPCPRAYAEWIDWWRVTDGLPRRQGHELTAGERARYEALDERERLAVTIDLDARPPGRDARRASRDRRGRGGRPRARGR